VGISQFLFTLVAREAKDGKWHGRENPDNGEKPADSGR
jgi:hypothetical protein